MSAQFDCLSSQRSARKSYEAEPQTWSMMKYWTALLTKVCVTERRTDVTAPCTKAQHRGEKLPAIAHQLPQTKDCWRFPAAHATRSATTLNKWAIYLRRMYSWLWKLLHCTDHAENPTAGTNHKQHRPVEKTDANVTKSSTIVLLLFAFLLVRLRIRKQGPPTRSRRTERRVAKERAQQKNLRFCDI